MTGGQIILGNFDLGVIKVGVTWYCDDVTG